MPRVFIPPLLRPLAGGAESVTAEGTTVAEVIESLERQFPGIGRHLREGGSLRAGIAVVVDGDVSPRGVLQRVEAQSEIHFLPAIGGG
jgi:sulfur-carrier protein